ncbi:polygalacturonase-like [Salvia splendens]|uniref:polygalacturonase-like n=1 Tax=Salvia splendens TaxID=180675 RepID=UPI001C2685E9|nr:polygalacturonase-like [Salvia splendens]
MTGHCSNPTDLRDIFILLDTDNGLRIKTFGPSPPGLVSDITFKNNTLNNVYNPIIIDQHYCPGSECEGGDSSVAIRGVKFIDIRGSSSTEVGVKIDCTKWHPCSGIELKRVSLTFKGKPTTAVCYSANVKFHGDETIPSSCTWK